MKWRTYQKYKPSGVDWLGEIPEHWDVVRFKYVLWLQRGHDLPATEFDEGEYPVCGSNGCIGYHNQFTTKGPGVTVGRSGSVGEVNYVDTDYWAHNTALYVKEFRRSNPRYAFFLLKTLDVKYLSEGTAVGTLNRNYIHNLPIAIPVETEQRAIAAFLDRETSRIDTLIEKKQRQIELLQEKRAALISHAVTKGLDPSVKMKNSGIEWLGEIPEHWEVKALKYVFRILNGSTPRSGEPFYWDGDIPWATPDDLGSLQGDSLFSTRRMITKDGYNSCGTSLAPAGSLVLSTRAPIGHLAIAAVPLCTNQGCRCLVFHAKDETRFFYYQLLTARQELESWGQGSTFQELSRDKLGAIYLVAPPLSEQCAIAAFLDRETARIDTLIEKIRKSIDLLREYRTALITAAVTGKTKVNDECGKMNDE